MAFFLIISAVILRIAPHVPVLKFIPHIPNFMPIAAIAFFCGTYLNRRYALGLAIFIMLISDYIIGFYNPWIMLSVYGCIFIMGAAGLWLKNHKTIKNIFGITVLGSILFYLVTNFAVWAIPHSLYAHTLPGLIKCYIMALPFFRNSLAGDMFYVGLMFGLYELILYLGVKRRVGWQAVSKT